MTPPAWTDDAIWYTVYPLGFVGAPIRDVAPPGNGGAPVVVHRLDRLIAWLDHLVALGCNGLLLGPIFSSVSHGYDTLDHYAIDPRLGDDADFDRLVEQCRARGVRLVLDGVFNHVSDRHPALARALADPGSPEAGWFHIDYDAQPPTWRDFEGHSDLVRLNHANPEVVDFVADVMRHWLRRGIDGWRLDAAYSVDPGFWADVLPRVRDEFPEALFVGEVIHTHEDRLAASTIESITAYELWKATWGSIRDRNMFELNWTLGRHDHLLDIDRPLTFVGNHDVTRIATQVGPAGSVLALVVMATVGGMPSIYYGDEGGTTGTKYDRLGGDDEVRPEMPASPGQWRPPEPWLVPLHQELLGLRRRNPWLVDARVAITTLENQRIVYRSSSQDSWLDVELDVRGGHRATVTGPEGELFRYEQA
ncbi:alpha-amylase family protein [Brooklawnia cerclae]|uniref:Alpha-amylase n=1 Tax=Brooklawnia cerclae TaxID=349934 RepID=A0ABX0SMZ0_9ACTN|nr:alpha-amylase family protein [Brooklawnia cerclae]NIH58136.1 glycosidase [Brooklawnia cerclae]